MELGSEYNFRFEELKVSSNNIYNLLNEFSVIYLNSGRSAIQLLDNHIPEGEILIPNFICNIAYDSFVSHTIKFYKLKDNMDVDIEDLEQKISSKTRAVLVMNYFGHVQPEYVRISLENMKEKYSISIIEDTTHSFFSNPLTIGDYGICSLRKWMPIPDGGVLYARESLRDLELRDIAVNNDIQKIYGMILKTMFLDLDIDCNSEYRKIFIDAEEQLDQQQLPLRISNLSKEIMSHLDIIEIINKRKYNYQQLQKLLEKINVYPICQRLDSECPLTFPIKVEDRDSFRNYLMDNKIYCAVHWPVKGTALESDHWSKELSSKIISLPIDQRYGLDEMHYLADTISRYERGDNGSHFI